MPWADTMAERAPVAVAVFIKDRVEQFRPTIRSLRIAFPESTITVGTWTDQLRTDVTASFGDLDRVEIMGAASVGEMANRLADHSEIVVAVDDTVIVAPSFGEEFEETFADARVVASCYLSNGAGYLSFPHARTPSNHQIGDHDEVSLAAALATEPNVGLTIVPYLSGALVAFSGAALRTFPLRTDPNRRFEVIAAEFSVRLGARSFQSMLDTRRFVSRPSDTTVAEGSSVLSAEEVNWIRTIHRHAGAALGADPEFGEAPYWTALTLARVKALGLRIVIDGSCLGPKEMGTQVQTLALIEHLAEHDQIGSIGVSLRGPVPAYAVEVLSHPKVEAKFCPNNDISGFGHIDVAHRPFQPDLEYDAELIGKSATRTLVTMQDVIAYQNSSYLPDAKSWFELRRKVRKAVAKVDGVISISHDTVRQLELEGLPIDPDRLFVAENGVDHLSGNEPASMPAALGRPGLAAARFITVIGANYSHKNRDLAIRAVGDLRRRGHDVHLVTVGALVPHGSLRAEEALALDDLDRDGSGSHWLTSLADVTSAERNWLLRHSDLVLYPTSAEGFGLVPFESAMFGTPTVSVGFGPLDEIAPDLPVRATTWDPSDLADACEQLLRDPDLASAQITSARSAASTYTWDRTAALLVDAYRAVLARPAKEW